MVTKNESRTEGQESSISPGDKITYEVSVVGTEYNAVVTEVRDGGFIDLVRVNDGDLSEVLKVPRKTSERQGGWTPGWNGRGDDDE